MLQDKITQLNPAAQRLAIPLRPALRPLPIKEAAAPVPARPIISPTILNRLQPKPVETEVAKQEEPKDVVPEAAPAISEAAIEEAPVEEAPQQEAVTASITAVEPAAEAPKKRTRTKTEKTAEAGDASPETIKIVDIPRMACGLKEASESLFPRIRDEEWEAIEARIREELKAVRFDTSHADFSPGSVRALTENVNNLVLEVGLYLQEAKTAYENMISKDKVPGEVERAMALGGTGSNEAERRYNGLLAACQFKTPGGVVVNVFEVTNEFRRRYNFLQVVMDYLSKTTSHLVSINATLKMDKDTTLN